jgi:hypothetical protein
MPEPIQPPPPHSSSGPRVAALIVGSLLGLLAVVLVAAGGLMLWGDGQKDRDGYLSTSSDRFAAGGYAVTSDDLDVDLGAQGALVDRDTFGNVRLKATSHNGKPVFVGIAPTGDVSAYLRASAHSSVTDLDASPFRVTYRAHPGDRRPAAPAQQRFWAASAHGSGTQTMTWKVRDGSWSVVVMNADGSRGVDAGVSAGASVPFLTPLAWVSLGGGLLLLAVSGGLIYLGARTPRRRPDRPEALRTAALVG